MDLHVMELMLMPAKKPTPALTIVNVGYRSTNYWVISAGTSRLLVDIGWPGSLGMMKANLAQKGIPMHEIRYALATHYHIDHAGLGEEIKRAGVPLLVIDMQVAAIPIMTQWTKPWDNYVEITTKGNVVISCAQSRTLLHQLGIAGEIVPTPGHSDHCVSVLLANGSVFTGDLPGQVLRAHGATRVYPAHGPIRNIDATMGEGA